MNSGATENPTPSKKVKIFFPNLDGVRAIAAMMVVIAHIESHKTDFSFERFTLLNLVPMGRMGVTLFFVLSGFLITYLLLVERRMQNYINYKNFYIRRILRIWPLYFLVLFTGYFIYPRGMSGTPFILSIFLMPNVAFVIGLPNVIDPIWSIGVEEQFYLIQPHLLRIKKIKTVVIAMAILLLVFYLAKVGLMLWKQQGETIHFLRLLMYYSPFDNMLLGSLSALFFFNEEKSEFKRTAFARMVFNKNVQLITYFFFIGYILAVLIYPKILASELLAVLTTIIILNLCKPDSSIVALQNKGFNYIGKISYGIYLLHKLPLFIILFISRKYLSLSSPVLVNAVIYSFTIIFTIVIAGLSYKYYESYFLTLKKRFAKIEKV
jgi:peptidoglycan/LPS O-acetylase OafA/YrhL